MCEDLSRASRLCEFCNFSVNHDSLAGGHVAQSRRLARGKVLEARDMGAQHRFASHEANCTRLEWHSFVVALMFSLLS